jgi:hypothetical protein
MFNFMEFFLPIESIKSLPHKEKLTVKVLLGRLSMVPPA